ncbi:MAG: MFS transporter [Streptosporangiales bacterium]|nr:MFS transporter [Streptosporangiales bacterium]
MDATIVATAVPSIVADLGGFALFPWVFSAYLLAQAVTIPIYGRLADLYGRKPVLLAGTVVFLVGSLVCALAWNMVALIVFRALQGIGAGAIQPITQTVVGDLYSVAERGRVAGWFSSVWGVSAVAAPALGGAFAEYVSWRLIFWINLPVGAAALLMVGIYLREQVVRRRHRIDVAGALLLVLGTGVLMFVLLQGGTRWGWASAPSAVLFAVVAVAVAAFVWWERRAADPVLPPWVYGHRVLAGANLGNGAVGVLSIGLTSFLPTFAQGVLGASAVAAGVTLAFMSIGWTLAAANSARLYLRLGFRDTTLLGLGFALASAVMLSLTAEDASLAYLGVASFVMGLGMGLTATSMLVGAQSVIGWGRRGVVTGSAMFARMIGMALGASLYGAIANSTLAAWFAAAPRALRGRLPGGLDEASRALSGGSHRLDPAAAAYVREGLFHAGRWVFVGLVVLAVLALLAVAIAPRRFEPLE